MYNETLDNTRTIPLLGPHYVDNYFFKHVNNKTHFEYTYTVLNWSHQYHQEENNINQPRPIVDDKKMFKH